MSTAILWRNPPTIGPNLLGTAIVLSVLVRAVYRATDRITVPPSLVFRPDFVSAASCGTPSRVNSSMGYVLAFHLVEPSALSLPFRPK